VAVCVPCFAYHMVVRAHTKQETRRHVNATSSNGSLLSKSAPQIRDRRWIASIDGTRRSKQQIPCLACLLLPPFLPFLVVGSQSQSKGGSRCVCV